MSVSMQVRCAQCGYESDSRYRFCGMCGAKLPEPRSGSSPEAAATQPKAAREQPHSAAGPSILGLTSEPAHSVAYLLEDEERTFHWGRLLVAIVLLAGIAAAAWQWRHDLRSWVAAKLAPQPAATQTEQANPSASPPLTSGSETPAPAPSGQGVPEKPPAENAAEPLGQSPPPASAAPQEKAATGTEPQQPPTAVEAPTQAQAAENPPATQPAAQQNEPLATTGESSEDISAKKPAAPPRAPKPHAAVASGSTGDALEAEGEKYLYGNGVSVNCGRASRDLSAAAQRSSSKAASVLGTMYATGHCVTRDLPQAYHWFAKAMHQEPDNTRFQRDLQVLWNQMTPEERKVAMQHE